MKKKYEACITFKPQIKMFYLKLSVISQIPNPLLQLCIYLCAYSISDTELLLRHGHLFFGQPLLLLLLPPAFLFLSDLSSILPPSLQLLQLLLSLSLSLSQLLHLLALLLLEAPPDLLQTLLCLQDGLRLLWFSSSATHSTTV